MRLIKDENLAEIIGMTLGDGNLGNYPNYSRPSSSLPRCQYLRIYCNLKETQYALEIEKILSTVFKKKAYWYNRPAEGVCYLEISGKHIDKFLMIPVGNKIKNKVKIPRWILNKKSTLVACLRGIFDTDGCCYQTGGKYRIINFTNKNPKLIEDIEGALRKLKFNPYKVGEDKVELGRQKEVVEFFNSVRPKNAKHYRFFAGVADLVKARV